MFFLDKVSELGDGLLVTNVQDVKLGLESLLVELRHGGLAPGLVSGREVHIPAELLAQRPHDTEPDALVGSCHNSYRHFNF